MGCFEAVVRIFGRGAWVFSFWVWVWDGRKIAGIIEVSETADTLSFGMEPLAHVG